MPNSQSSNTNSILKKLTAAGLVTGAQANLECFKDHADNIYCMQFTKISDEVFRLIQSLPTFCKDLLPASTPDQNLNLRHTFWDVKLLSNLQNDLNPQEICIVDEFKKHAKFDFTNYIPIAMVIVATLLALLLVVLRCRKLNASQARAPLHQVSIGQPGRLTSASTEEIELPLRQIEDMPTEENRLVPTRPGGYGSIW